MFSKDKKKKVKVINVEGVIMGGSSTESIMGSKNGADDLIKELRRIAKDDEIKGVLIRINSPGGAAAASQEVYELIQQVRKNKIVVASMADVACSGGYMIAAACDHIVASPSTFTGSIGVIMQMPHYQELAEKVGYAVETIKAGKLKDIGNPMREMTVEERQLLTSMAAECHEEFIRLVAAGRKMDVEAVRVVADGRVMTGRQAYEVDLVDELGNYYTAVEALCKLINCTEENIEFIEEKKKKGFISRLLNLESVFDRFIPKAGILFK